MTTNTWDREWKALPEDTQYLYRDVVQILTSEIKQVNGQSIIEYVMYTGEEKRHQYIVKPAHEQYIRQMFLRRELVVGVPCTITICKRANDRSNTNTFWVRSVASIPLSTRSKRKAKPESTACRPLTVDDFC